MPFFITKRSGSGIGLSLSRRMMIQQGGMLDLAETPRHGCCAAFLLTFSVSEK
jgi:signal transduction histidine kinase